MLFDTITGTSGWIIRRASATRSSAPLEYCARGAGFMGSSLDYLKDIHRQFVALDIQDNEVFELLRETDAYINS